MPFELRHVNVYLLRDGDNFTLVDTGLQTEESRQALNEKLAALQVPVDRINRILITHIHPDHFGLAGELRERARAELVIHRLEVALMEPRYARAEDLVHDVAAWLSKNGVPPAEAEFVKTASMAAREFVSVVEPDTLLEGAERLPIDATELEVVWTPGHSPGHCVMYFRREKVLIVGDHLLPKITPHVGIVSDNAGDPLGDFLASLRKVGELDVETVLPAHGAVYHDHRKRVSQLIEFHEYRMQVMLDIVRGRPRTAYETALEAFDLTRESPFQQQFPATFETLAHLEHMRLQGRTEKVERGDKIIWRAKAVQ